MAPVNVNPLSVEWRRLREHLDEKLQAYGRQLEALTLPVERTVEIRGRIAEIRGLIADVEGTPRPQGLAAVLTDPG